MNWRRSPGRTPSRASPRSTASRASRASPDHGKAAASRFACVAKAAKKRGYGVDPSCTTKARAKLAAAFLKAEAKGDCLAAIGDAPTIASLSIGAQRVFAMKHRSRGLGERIALPSGSLLVMAGGTQRHWKHGIHRQTRSCGERVNLTFRHIVPPAR